MSRVSAVPYSSRMKEIYRVKSVKLLRVTGALWMVAQNSHQQSSYSENNRSNFKLPEHQIKECRELLPALDLRISKIHTMSLLSL